MNRLPYLAQRMFNVPLAIAPAKAEVIIAALADRLGVAHMFGPGGETVTPSSDGRAVRMSDGRVVRISDGRAVRISDGRAVRISDGRAVRAMAFWDDGEPRRSIDKGYDVIEGVALIHVGGTLVQKNGYLRPYSGMTGYDGIRQNLFTALADADVKAIALDVDSPGGEVAGCFDLADTIFAARGEKPIWAILDECAYSAAYALASACDRITVPRTGGTGSIGVVCAHVDWSKAMSSAGVTVTFIQHGALKTDCASEKPLSNEAQARLQSDIDTMGELFCDTVARNRGMAASEIRAMEAGTFLGLAGVTAGLADAVMAPDAAFRELLDSLP